MYDWFVAKMDNGEQIRCRQNMRKLVSVSKNPYRIELFWTKSADIVSDRDFVTKLEEQLVYVLESSDTAHLVAVSEDDKQYILTWYAASLSDASFKINGLLSLFPPLPVKLVGTEDPQWSTYDRLEHIV